MTVRSYAGAAKRTTLSAGITNSALSFTVMAGGGTGYPTGADGPFVVALDTGASGEEKVLCSARAGDTFTVQAGGRGYDDTTASAHSLNAPVDHVGAAIDFREANAHVNDTTGTPHPQYANPTTTTAEVATAETTNSVAYGNLTTPGPAVTVTVGSSGELLIRISASGFMTDVTDFAVVTFALSGANTLAASDAYPIVLMSPSTTSGPELSSFFVLTGLTPGATTVTLKYRTNGGTANLRRRRLAVTAL